MINVSFLTDEATQDFAEAVKFAKQNGLQGLELRSVQDTPIDALDRETLREFRRVLDAEGLQVPDLAGSFYKCDPTDETAVRENLQKLERLCDAADILNCRFLRGFAFFAPPGGQLPAAGLAPFFAEPERILRRRGKVLLLEADPTVNTSNHAAVAQLLRLLDSPCFGAIYDPGNDLYDPHRERPYPDGYEAVRPYLRHVHIKDAVYDAAGQPCCVRVGDGLVPYPALLRRLVQDGYDGWLSLETHYRKNAALTEEQMRLPQGSGFSHGGLEATAESAAALRELLRTAEGEYEA